MQKKITYFNILSTNIIKLFTIIIILSSCNSRIKFRRAVKLDTTIGYIDFINGFPKSKFIRIAKDSLSNKLDDIAYKEALTENKSLSFLNYLKNYPLGHHRDAATLLNAVLSDKEDWAHYNAIGTLTAYQKYINNYPNGYKSAECKEQIKRIEESNAYSLAMSSSSIYYCEQYLLSFPITNRTSIIQHRINKLKDSLLWEESINEISPDKIEYYLSKYQDGLYTATANHIKFDVDHNYKDWIAARTNNTIEAYRKFAKDHNTSIFFDSANLRLEQLKNSLWDLAEANQNIIAYRNFGKQFPNDERCKQINEIVEDIEWQRTKEENTIISYNNYITQNRSSKYYNDAYTSLELLIWAKCNEDNTVLAYQKYLNLYKNGQYSQDARSMIESLFYSECQAENTISGYNKYLLKYKNGEFRDDALSSIEFIIWEDAQSSRSSIKIKKYITKYKNGQFENEAIELLETVLWEEAESINTIAAYKRFLNEFPYSANSETAKGKIIDLEVDQIFRGDYGKLPEMENQSYGKTSSYTEIDVFNNTKYILTLRYSGPESKKIELWPGSRSKVTLTNGSYRIAASVSASHVRNYAGSEYLSGGLYNSEYYIITTNY